MTAIDELTKLIRDTHAGCATRDEYRGHSDRIDSLERSRDRAKTAGKVVTWLGAPAVALLNWDAMSDFLKSFFR